jgi:hypothetical protein
MGKIPAWLIAALLLWVAWDLYQQGPERALGGLFSLLAQPQYGEADRPTRSGDLADHVLAEEEQEARRSAAREER